MENLKEKDTITEETGTTEAAEVKKRGRKKYEDMTESEKEEYNKKKELKELERLEKERLKSLGVNPVSLKDNVISVELTDEFIKKCKKEKITEAYYVDVIYSLIKKFSNDEIELKKETRTVFF